MIDSLFAQYKKEKDGIEVLETEKGFMSYKILGDYLYIEDAFVRACDRQTGVGSEMLSWVDEIARANGCKYLMSHVIPSESVATTSLLSQLKKGFQVFKAIENKIILIREVKP